MLTPTSNPLYPCTIGILKHTDNVRGITWEILENPKTHYKESNYFYLTQGEKDMIDMISEGNLVKIQAILSNYYV